MSEGFLEFPKD